MHTRGFVRRVGPRSVGGEVRSAWSICNVLGAGQTAPSRPDKACGAEGPADSAAASARGRWGQQAAGAGHRGACRGAWTEECCRRGAGVSAGGEGLRGLQRQNRGAGLVKARRNVVWVRCPLIHAGQHTQLSKPAAGVALGMPGCVPQWSWAGAIPEDKTDKTDLGGGERGAACCGRMQRTPRMRRAHDAET